MNDERVDPKGTQDYFNQLQLLNKHSRVCINILDNCNHDGPIDLNERFVLYANEINFLQHIVKNDGVTM